MGDRYRVPLLTTVRVVNHTKQTLVAARVAIARTWWQRAVGLLGRSALADGEGLLLAPCRSIHTCGMRFPIDVVLLDRHVQVVRCLRQVVPFRVTPPVWRAWAALELAAGSILTSRTEVGDTFGVDPRPEFLKLNA